MTGTALRRLPVTARPACFESLDSYVSRLADVNRISTDELRETLGRPGFTSLEGRVTTDQISALTGFAAGQLTIALVELRTPRRLNWNVFHPNPLPACPRCTGGHPGRPVQRFHPHHAPACREHKLWIGTGWFPHDRAEGRFVDISRTPEILTAQRRHQQFVRRYGAKAVKDGYVLAGNFLHREDSPRPAPDTERLLAELRPAGPSSFPDPAHHAARYPRTIHVAALFITPRWRELAASYAWSQFYAELSIRCFGHPDYIPNGNNAVYRWLCQQTTP